MAKRWYICRWCGCRSRLRWKLHRCHEDLPALLQPGYSEERVRQAIAAGMCVLGDLGEDDVTQAVEVIMRELAGGAT